MQDISPWLLTGYMEKVVLISGTCLYTLIAVLLPILQIMCFTVTALQAKSKFKTHQIDENLTRKQRECQEPSFNLFYIRLRLCLPKEVHNSYSCSETAKIMPILCVSFETHFFIQ